MKNFIVASIWLFIIFLIYVAFKAIRFIVLPMEGVDDSIFGVALILCSAYQSLHLSGM